MALPASLAAQGVFERDGRIYFPSATFINVDEQGRPDLTPMDNSLGPHGGAIRFDNSDVRADGDYYSIPSSAAQTPWAYGAPNDEGLFGGAMSLVNSPVGKAIALFTGANALSGGALTAPGAATASIGDLAGNFASGVGNTVTNAASSLESILGGNASTGASSGGGLANVSSGFGDVPPSLGMSGAGGGSFAGSAVPPSLGGTVAGIGGSLAPSAAAFAPLGLSALGSAATGAAGAAGAGAATGAATGAAGATGAAASAATLAKIMRGEGTLEDFLSIGLKAAPGVIGAFGANAQGDAMRDLISADTARYQQNFNLGAPSRERYEASFAPGFDLSAADPALRGAMDTTMDTLLRRLSTEGNPFGNPGGLAEANEYVMGNVALPALQNYRTLNANTGGYSGYNNSAASGPNMNLQTGALQADTNVWNSLGAATSDVFNPRSSFEDVLRRLGGSTGLA